MGLFDIFRRKSAPTVVGEADPRDELETFLRRLSPRERERFNDAFAKHGGDIKSLAKLRYRFDAVEARLIHARSQGLTPGDRLRRARWARDHANHIVLLAKHLQSIEMRKHDKDLARDSFAVRRYADHAKEQAQSLIDRLQLIVR